MVGKLHQAPCLAVSLGPRHAEIAVHPGFRIRTLFVTDHHHGTAAKSPKTADNRHVLRERPITGKRREIRDQTGYAIHRMRPALMTRDQDLLPRRELVIGLGEKPVSLDLKLGHLFSDIHVTVGVEVPQFLDLAFKLGDGFFEIKIIGHE